MTPSEPSTPQRPTVEPELDPRAILAVLRRRAPLIVGCTLALGVAAYLYATSLPRVYQATSTIEYDPSPVRPLGSEVETIGDPIGNYWRGQEFFQTQNELLRSRSLAERVVVDNGLDADPAYTGPAVDGVDPVVAAAQRLQGRISVEPVENTRLVRVSVADPLPERAQALTNSLVDSYIAKTIEDRLASTLSANDWLEAQSHKLRTELDAAELALHTFKEEHNVLSVSLEDQRNLVAQEIQHFSDALAGLRERRIALTARMEVIRQADRDDPLAVHAPVATSDGALVQLRQKIHEAEQAQASLAVRYGENHPDITRGAAALATLHTQYKAELERVIDSAAAELAEARKTEAGLKSALDNAHDAGLRLNLREIEYNRLSRERENKAGVYTLVLQRATEADLTRMLQTTFVRVVDRALTPETPIAPNVTKHTAMGLGFGLLLGLGVTFLLYRLDRRVRTVAEAEALGAAVLGVLPSLATEGAAAPRKRPKRPAAHSPALDLLVHRQPHSVAAECCRSIRTNLMFMAVDEPLRSLVVTSGRAEEGKTTVLTSLAVSLAQSSKRVLVVDTDLRRPQLHRAFDVDPSVGVTSVLAGAASLEEAVQKTEVPGLSILPVGPIPPNPAELLGSRPFAALHTELLSRYDVVLFDSPPVNLVTDSAVLAPQVDGVIVVLKAESTTRDALRASLRRLGDVSGHVVGLVLNQVDLAARGAYAEGYERYGYGYGAYGSTEARSGPVAAE